MCKISYNQYGGYCVPLSSRHRPAVRKVLDGKVHEPQTVAFILANCGTGDVVQAGAYFGDFLPALGGGVAADAKVWCFEPNRENYRCAAITVAINGLANIELANAGLGSRDEMLSVRVVDEHGRALGGASEIVAESADAHAQPVRIVAVDNVVAPDRHVSILQLDVEGYEQQALKGALKTIRRCLPILILEVLPTSTLLESEWFCENIRRLGYNERCKLHRNIVFACGSVAGRSSDTEAGKIKSGAWDSNTRAGV
ncbi:methyltransferase, FkbM family [Frateuria terrea]|uniref:Methyltransferase, FkbM family n=2 Tax=Frateuria terrea TaxID=529704 RepID=A0A1H6XUG1_9GAMM|nr:methyltransferase, FkbM family [Frateuria terrea]SFP51307.1 methyltransferase, FkbM family [Frateuria terrea]